MLPTLKSGQKALVYSWFFKPKIGDIIVVKMQDIDIIKRIKAISESGVFVEGDNKKESIDSRLFGPVLRQEIVGKVVYVR